MPSEYKQPPGIDLDKTDRLPILEDTQVDPDVADDAVPLDQTAVLPTGAFTGGGAHRRFCAAVRGRSALVGAERAFGGGAHHAAKRRVRSAAPRVRARAGGRGRAGSARPCADRGALAAARTALEAEHGRSRELERTLAERSSAAESARSRAEEALRDAERHQTEARTLRESLAARDANIVQVLHSLGERDAQLSALQQEHAKIVPALEATAKSTTQLESDLRSARAEAQCIGRGARGQPRKDGGAQPAGEPQRSRNQCHAIRSGSREDPGEQLSRFAAHSGVAPRLR